MAIKVRVGNKSLLTSRNFNFQSKAMIDYRGLIVPLSIDSFTDTEISVSNAYLSGLYSIIYIESATIGYDPDVMAEPRFLVLKTKMELVLLKT